VFNIENKRRLKMKLSTSVIAAVALSLPTAILAQVTEDTPFQVRYAANLNIGDSIVNITNSGASSTTPFTNNMMPQDGNICANVYVFLPNEQIAACCSCFVSPNGLLSLSVKNDLINNPLIPIPAPTSVVIKLLATKAGSAPSTCTNAAALAGTSGNGTVSGMVAYGTTLHAILDSKKTPTYTVTETKFTQATLSSAELKTLTTFCSVIIGNGSGLGVCGCGAATQQ
jgi:hypothetical protein